MQKSGRINLSLKLIFIYLSILLFSFDILAQKDTTARILTQDTIQPVPAKVHSPRKAAFYSMALPGLGQAYNKKYWKIPIIYGLGGTLGYFIGFNNKLFVDLKVSVEAKLNQTPDLDPYPRLSLESAKLNRDFSKRNRDFLIILTVLLYGLNIADAVVDAHLKSFDVKDDLGFRIEPKTQYVWNQPYTSLAFTIDINKKK